MEKSRSKEEQYVAARQLHVSFELRLRMLLKKPYLSEDEELEVRLVKKKKLYYKDLMERLGEEMREQR